jgi:hypothetical protein
VLSSLLATVLVTALAPPVVLHAGPLKLTIHDSEAAQLFHIVDQLSVWNIYCHPQYRAGLGAFSPAEEQLLRTHAKVRAAHGYGVIDEVFYAESDWRTALDRAVAAGRLSRSEADTERKVVSAFAAKLKPFIAAGRPAVTRAINKLRAHGPELTVFARKAARFTGQTALDVPVYLIPSHGLGGGGGMNGGILVVEVGASVDPYYTLLHEAWHGFVERQAAALDAACASVPDLDRTLLAEGLAYAVYPGLYHPGQEDALLEQVRADLRDIKTNHDERSRRLAWFRRYGLALRPLLAAALEDPNQTLAGFLPRACDVFRALASLSPALEDARPQGIFVLGPHVASLWSWVTAQHTNVWRRDHDAQGYEALTHAQPGDVVLLVFTAAQPAGSVPEAWRDLLPVAPEQVKAALDAGTSLEATAVRRQCNVILLAAPDAAGVAELARKSPLLAKVLPKPPSH